MANLVEILETMNKNTDDLLEEIINIKKRLEILENKSKDENIDIETEAQKLATKMLRDKQIKDRANEIYQEKLALYKCSNSIKIVNEKDKGV